MSTKNILVLIVFLSSLVCLCISTDTITLNQTLKDGDLLISNANSYALGFFTPGKSSGKRYVGIWYQKIPERAVVWVANRNNPVNGTSGILFIDPTGNLVIQDTKTNISVWNTSLISPATGSKTYSCQLQETGNLVLYEGPDKWSVAWQSFDHPTNTLLPGQRFGVDKKRGMNMSMVSWKSPDDPGTGEYVLGMDLGMTPPQSMMYKNGAPVWRPGAWNGLSWSSVPEMIRNGFVNCTYTENEDEVTQSFQMINETVYNIIVLNESGTWNSIIWQGDEHMKSWVGVWYQPKDNCDSYNHCGAFGICNSLGVFDCRCVPGFGTSGSGGSRLRCQRNKTDDDTCRGDKFIKVPNMNIPDIKMSRFDRNIGLSECEEMCRNNCSCTGYASPNITDQDYGCVTWYGDLIDMREFAKGGQDMYFRVSASDLAQPENKSKGLHGGRLIVIAVVAPVIALVILLLFYLAMKMKKGKKQPNNTNLESYEGPAEEKGIDDETVPSGDVSIFDLNSIIVATNNFDEENKLGEGGFGSVYKGKLQNGQLNELIAVKRLTRTSRQGMEEFTNEVKLIARLQHRNLVRLLGCCIQQGEKMLVYEYLANKSLDSFIFDNNQGALLDWGKRFEIILGIAQGLLYLHQDSRLRIIHRDLKASNVLLDESMNPKISDFGMARIFKEEQNEANTNRVVGTYGYMSPEYAMEGHFSVKSDVFSFGVLLLEIVSGKKNKYTYNENSLCLIGDAWEFWNEGKALDIVDPLLGESYDDQEVLRCIHVGLLCVQPFPNDRPIMSEVIFMLCNDTELPRPNPPRFISIQGNIAPFLSSTSDRDQTINTMSLTVIEGR